MNRPGVRLIATSLVLGLFLHPWGIALSNQEEEPVRFAVIGDSGTGGRAQRQVAAQMARTHRQFPFEFVLMLGDNLYGDEDPEDYREKFEQPYQPLLDAGVKFYAALGNHDDPTQRFYERFHMGGDRYYTFNPSTQSVRFFALDTNYMDPEQLRWLRTELESSNSEWTICFFHHPIYSSGERHGSNLPLRKTLEPLFVEHNVDVVFSGHDHVYERIKPQHGIYYFVSGNSAKLRRGGLGPSRLTAKGFDQGHSFMLIAIAGRVLQFQTISSEGRIVDAGLIRARPQELSGALGISLAHPSRGSHGTVAQRWPPTGSTDAAGRGVSPDHPCGAAGDGCDGPHREARDRSGMIIEESVCLHLLRCARPKRSVSRSSSAP